MGTVGEEGTYLLVVVVVLAEANEVISFVLPSLFWFHVRDL